MTDVSVRVKAPRQSWSGAIVLGATVCLVLACMFQAKFGYSGFPPSGHAFGSDDAYISYRYAKNLFFGHGLTFNPGEFVEGYSNLLYVLLIAPGFLLVPSASIYWWSLGLNIVCAVVALLTFRRIARQTIGDMPSAVACWVLAISPVLWMWTASGLETSLVLMLQLLIWAAVETSEKPKAIALIVLSTCLVLVRPDGLLVPAVAAFYLAVTGRWRLSAMIVAATVGSVACLTLWRYWYYGAWLPNTFYVKVAGPVVDRLVLAARQFRRIAPATGLLLFAVLILAAPVTAWLKDRRISLRAPWVFPAASASVLLAYWFYVGGDVYDERFLLALMPFGLFCGLGVLREVNALAGVPVLAVLLIAAQLTALNHHGESRFSFRWKRYDFLQTLSGVLKTHAGNTVLATTAAGKMPYWTDFTTIDMFGLNDRTIAAEPAHERSPVGHGKYDADYVLSRHPDLIASFIVSDDFDLNAGMAAERYRQAGYRLRYLVNAQQDSLGTDIVDVEGADAAAIRRYIQRGYIFAVLTHQMAGGVQQGATALREIRE